MHYVRRMCFQVNICQTNTILYLAVLTEFYFILHAMRYLGNYVVTLFDQIIPKYLMDHTTKTLFLCIIFPRY